MTLNTPRTLVLSALTVLMLGALAGATMRSSAVQSTNDAYVLADYTVVAPKVAGFIQQVLVEDNQH